MSGSAIALIILSTRYRTRDEARQDGFDYVEMFYNPVRRCVRNGMLSHAEFERRQNLKAEGVQKPGAVHTSPRRAAGRLGEVWFRCRS